MQESLGIGIVFTINFALCAIRKFLKKIGADAVLIGGTLMRAADKKKILDEFKSI